MSTLEGLNIMDFEDHCRRFLFHRSLYCRYVYCSLKSLENVIKDRLNTTSRYHVESRFHEFAKEANHLMQLLAVESGDMSQALRDLDALGDTRILNFNYSYDLMTSYFLFVLRRIDQCETQSEAAVIARKVLGAFTVMHLDSTVTVENSFLVVLLMQTMHFCYRLEVRDSKLVADLVKLAIDKSQLRRVDFEVLYILENDQYLLYLLEHCRIAQFDISLYDCCREKVGLSQFRELFSILSNVSSGDLNRTRLLLQYGLEDDYTDEVLTTEDLTSPFGATGFRLGVSNRPFLMILRMMHALKLRLFWENSDPDETCQDKKACFLLVWRSIPDPYVTSSELLAAIAQKGAQKTAPDQEEEIVHCLTHVVYLYKVYVDNFPEVAYQVAQPRCLKHLSRCATRKQLKTCGQLPSGIFSLPIPRSLHEYMNLETD